MTSNISLTEHRTLNPDNYEDMLMIDEFNKNLYNKYKSSGGQLKNNKLDELVLDPDTGRVYVKDLTVYDDDGNKISSANYTYSISARKIGNGEYKNYIVRHKNKYTYANKPNNKFEYLLKIADGVSDSSESTSDSESDSNEVKFVIPDLKVNSNITKQLYDYLNNPNIDVTNKIKLQQCIKDVLTKPANEERHKDFYSKCGDLSNIISRNQYIPAQYKFTLKQIANWIYRINH